MLVTIKNLEAAAAEIRKHSDVEVTVDETHFHVQATPPVLAEFELCLALELASPRVGESALQPVRIRNYFVDIVDSRKEAQGSADEQVWSYETAAAWDLRAHEVISL